MATLIIMWITTVLFILTFTTTLIQYLIMTNKLSSKIFIVLNITFEQEGYCLFLLLLDSELIVFYYQTVVHKTSIVFK